MHRQRTVMLRPLWSDKRSQLSGRNILDSQFCPLPFVSAVLLRHLQPESFCVELFYFSKIAGRKTADALLFANINVAPDF